MTRRSEIDANVLKALKILEMFGGTQNRFTFHEIASMVGGSTDEVMLIVRTLESDGFLDLDYERRAYRLGHRIFQLGMRYATEMEISQTIRPFAESLSRQFDQGVNVGIQVGAGVVVVMRIEPSHRFMNIPVTGTSLPIHASALGKALLAYQDPSDARQVLVTSDMMPFTEKTEKEIGHFLERIAGVRDRGYAIDDQELVPGLCSIAAPILDHRSMPIAAISLTGTCEGVDVNDAAQINAVRETALQISRLLGFPYTG